MPVALWPGSDKRATPSRVGVLVGMFLLGGCAPTPQTNLLLIVADTFRADALNCSEVATSTPNLCGLAARGVRFDNAYSHAPSTLRSSVTMFTGNHAPTYRRFQHERGGDDDWLYVPEQESLLAEGLAERGYATLAFLQNKLPSTANAMQGFAVDESLYLESTDYLSFESELGLDLSRGSSGVLAGALNYLLAGPSNFFVVQWILDPHAPYHPPDTFLASDDFNFDLLKRPIDYYTGLGHFNRPDDGKYSLERSLRSLSRYERRAIRRLYEIEVDWVDERVGYLLRALDLMGLSESTLVVFTSDHGEAFGEHGRYLHSSTLYDEMLRVPLLFAGPGIPEGVRVDARVSLADLMPTLDDLVDCRCLKRSRGRSLKPLMLDLRRSRDRTVYLANPGEQPARALIHDHFKLIANTETGTFELYDLSQDPGETTDLSASRVDLLEDLRGRLDRIVSADQRRRERMARFAGEEALDEAREETLRELEALGYLD